MLKNNFRSQGNVQPRALIWGRSTCCVALQPNGTNRTREMAPLAPRRFVLLLYCVGVKPHKCGEVVRVGLLPSYSLRRGAQCGGTWRHK